MTLINCLTLWVAWKMRWIFIAAFKIAWLVCVYLYLICGWTYLGIKWIVKKVKQRKQLKQLKESKVVIINE